MMWTKILNKMSDSILHGFLILVLYFQTTSSAFDKKGKGKKLSRQKFYNLDTFLLQRVLPFFQTMSLMLSRNHLELCQMPNFPSLLSIQWTALLSRTAQPSSTALSCTVTRRTSLAMERRSPRALTMLRRTWSMIKDKLSGSWVLSFTENRLVT